MLNTESNVNGRATCRRDDTSCATRMFGSDLVATSLPGRGLFFSLLVHVLFVAAFLYLPWSYWLPNQARLVTSQAMIQSHEVLLLPALEPMGMGGSSLSSSRSANKPKEDGSASEANARQGVVYKGPQLIVSDPPHPDNFMQTIQQPALMAAPKLPAALPLPALVSIASPKPELAPQPAPEIPHVTEPLQVAASAPATPRVEAPKLSLPPADALVHAVVADAVPTPMPKLAHQEPPAQPKKIERDILVVNAFSVPDIKPPAIPLGELSGAFTISPVGTTSMGLAGGGAAAKGVPGIGSVSSAVTGTSPAGVATTSNGGIGNKSAGGSGDENSARAVTASGTVTGHGGTGSGNAAGNGSGAGSHTLGSGNAPGAGSGSSPFPGIMIQGGSAGNVTGAPAVANHVVAKPQSSYGMTIVASGASGGGFKDYGVFRDETSYTVYLDMADAGARGKSWAMQYALDTHIASVPSAMTSHAHGQLVPPYATFKLLPSFSPEAAKRGHGGTIVIFGVINREGKFEDLRIMHSPEIGLNQFMLEALMKWTFRPAEVDGAQVSVKVLLGVPVNSVPENNVSLEIESTRSVSHETARF